MLSTDHWMNPIHVKQGSDGTADPTALRASQIINQHAAAGFLVGLAPLPPVFDIVAVTAIEVHMIAKLAEAYSVPIPQRHVLAKVLLSLAGGVAPVLISEKSVELMTVLPLLRYTVFRAALSVWGGVAVYAVGKVFQQHFESGGTFLSANSNLLRTLLPAKRERRPQLIS